MFRLFYWGLYASIALLLLLCAFMIKTFLLRRYYEKQGIPFVKNCYALIGAEMQVTNLRKKNKSHDWLYKERPIDLIGTIRGLSVQLYATSGEMSEKVIQRTGKTIDRNTPALYSFGQLSPFAITFTPLSTPFFAARKATLTRMLNDFSRLSDIATEQAVKVLDAFEVGKKDGNVVDIREILNRWTRETSGEFIWGKNNIDCTVDILDSTGRTSRTPFMTALNLTFTDLRFHSNAFWNRVYFPLAAWPITKEARRLAHNVQIVRAAMDRMMSSPEEGSVAQRVQQENDAASIPSGMTRDDLVTATIAGLDTVKSTTMGTLYNILLDRNRSWRERIVTEIKPAIADRNTVHSGLAHCDNLNAIIHETLRFEPPGSLINNEATEDFELTASDRTYSIKSGTRIMPCIHALHSNDRSWQNELLEENTPLETFDPSRFLLHGKDIVGSKFFMPFGKGPRRCPGQNVGVLMVKCFVATFLSRSPESTIILPEGQSGDLTCFNILSRATYYVDCGESGLI